MTIQSVSLRLAKLIPRLASTHDGEVVATARAIARVLREGDSDWHDLVAAIVSPPRPRLDQVSLFDMAYWLQTEVVDHLDDWERKFTRDMLRRLRAGLRASEKQEQALRRCYARHGAGNAPA